MADEGVLENGLTGTKVAVNFFKGHPSEDLLANDQVLTASQAVLGPKYRPGDSDDNDRHPLTYGSDPGSLTVRRRIAGWTNRLLDGGSQRPVIDADCVNLTNGASFGVQNALLLTTFPQSGYTRQAFVVSPTYFLINSIFLDAGFAGKLTPINQNADGTLDLERLEERLNFYDNQGEEDDLDSVLRLVGDRTKDHQKFYRYAMYLVPTFSNPRGGTIPLDTRVRLVELARKHDMLLICDDVYDMLKYRSDPVPPRLVTLDRDTLPSGYEGPGNTLSNCTFSKIVGPGLRVGWQESVTPYLCQQLCSGGAVRSGGTPAHLNSMIVGALLDLGLVDDIIGNLVRVYSKRAIAMKRAFEDYMPEGTVVEGGDGGYFLWVTLPDRYDGEKITTKCKDEGVILAPAVHFQVDGDPRLCRLDAKSFRVCLAYHTEEQIREGIKIWGDVCKICETTTDADRQ
jgi:DNA-binding transcriptional MocR family regulator